MVDISILHEDILETYDVVDKSDSLLFRYVEAVKDLQKETERLNNLERVLSSETVQDLLEDQVVFVGGDWVKDDNAPKDVPVKGMRCAGVHMCVNCNDFFYWASADAEGITLENLPELEKAVNECVAIDDGDESYTIGALLFCARQRKMRPQKPYYNYIPENMRKLFDACGDPR